jgi:uncharacterized protein (DUF1330 family)
MTVTLCVLLWANEGRQELLSDYEDTVLALIPDYGGTVRSRVRRIDDNEGPYEVQVIDLPSEDAIEAYLQDPARLALAATHRQAIARTELIRVESRI